MIEKKCPFCEKIIEGYTKKQVDYLLKQHILSKHKDKVNFHSPIKEKNIAERRSKK